MKRYLFVLMLFLSFCTERYGDDYHEKKETEKIVFNINSELKKTHPPSHTAILKGLKWSVLFVEKNKNFDYIFSDYLAMLYELTLNHNKPVIQKSAVQLVNIALKRATHRLNKIFPKTLAGKWDYIAILPMIYQSKVPLTPFINFYKDYFPKENKEYYDTSFQDALKTLNYDLLGDYLIDYYFVDWMERKFNHHPFNLPKNRFPKLIKKVTPLKYIHKADSDDYHDQNYYVTHVILVLSQYGKRRLNNNSSLEKKLKAYIDKHYHEVRHEVGDLDLLAEFILCLKIYGEGNNPKIQEGKNYLISLQHSDGSWGTEEDKKGDPYDIFHPTWAVITTLNYQ